jgi:non-ribosomal peptide synthetase component F
MLPDVVRAVREWAQRQPDELAIVGAGGDQTYSALWRDALDWERAIRAGLGPCAGASSSPVVAILRRRDTRLPAVQLGAWLAGAAYLPLDPGWPAAWTARILADAGCAMMVTDDGITDDGIADVGSAGSPDDAPNERDRLAYVIYTSGSTGGPKGVEVEHRGLGELLAWYGSRFKFGPALRVAMTAGLGFDQSVLDVWGTLSHGATLVVADERTVADVETLVEFLDAITCRRQWPNSCSPGRPGR